MPLTERPQRPSRSEVQPTDVHVIEPTGHALVQAIALSLGSDGQPAAMSAVSALTDFLAARESTLAGTFSVVKSAKDEPLFSAVASIGAGRTAMILTPDRLPTQPEARRLAVRCVEAACRAARDAGATLAQILLPRDAAEVGDQLVTANSFSDLAELHYLHKLVDGETTVRPLPDGYRLLNYSEDRRPMFEKAALDSYIGSLDCPELAELRTIDDVIEGHRAAGVFDPTDWHLLVDDTGSPQGLLLLCGLGLDGSAGVELVYLGISPDARGKGLGSLLLDHAEARAARSATNLLALAVDGRNEPGLQLYRKRGLHETERRRALIRDLRSM